MAWGGARRTRRGKRRLVPTDVVMPQMGESIFEGTITKWLKQTGDRVEKDEPLFEISTDKVDAEIPSPISGVLSEIKIPEGATVTVNTVVAVMSEGPALDAAASRKPSAPVGSSTAASVFAQPATPSAPSQLRATQVVMPQMGESIFEGTITKWLKKVGDRVEKDEPLFEISTDKVDAEIPAPVAGVLSEIRVPEGETVGVNTVVAVIGAVRRLRPPHCRRRLRSLPQCPRRQGRSHRSRPAREWQSGRRVFAPRLWCGAWLAKTISTWRRFPAPAPKTRNEG